MSSAHNPIRLFETVVDDCPYLEGQKSASILVDPDHQIDKNLFFSYIFIIFTKNTTN